MEFTCQNANLQQLPYLKGPQTYRYFMIKSTGSNLK